ncbi:hypothetical protein CAEBREN_25493 [Caenorhabditis brenneri]|uniref:Uncharacterized protein n=1 Tax=Caenorhabditis brenneri TaxID=135651 RepID=G0NI07_CAEBE|nr:hypothetical protein CAEBREN_25493 [Caenorhabditis brenneri]
MVRLSFLFLSLSILFVQVESVVTKFVFTGNFICDMPDFEYRIVLWEKDSSSSDDVMTVQGPKVSRDPHYYEITGEQDGDEILTIEPQSTYEVYMVIVHSCTHPEKPYRKLTVPLGEFPFRDKTYYKSVDINLINQGKLVTNIMGYEGFSGK